MFSDNKLRFHHFYFEGLAKPITIETTGTKEHARTILADVLTTLPEYRGKEIISETMSTPVTGVSQKMVKGRMHVWMGIKGWQPKETKL